MGRLERTGSYKIPKLKNDLDVFNQGSKPRKRRGQLNGLTVAPIAEDLAGEKSSDRKTIDSLEKDKQRIAHMNE